jgi:hypothetical protein
VKRAYFLFVNQYAQTIAQYGHVISHGLVIHIVPIQNIIHLHVKEKKNIYRFFSQDDCKENSSQALILPSVSEEKTSRPLLARHKAVMAPLVSLEEASKCL